MKLTRMLVFLGVVMLVFSSGVYVAVSASDDYDVTITPSIEIPEQTEEVEGTEVTIDSIGTVDAEAPIEVSVTVPDDTDWSIELRNADNQIVDMAHGTDSADVSFDGVEPGSYVVVLGAGGIQDIAPLVSNAYDVSADAPSQIAHDESVTVSASFDAIEDVGYTDVEAVLWNGKETRQTMDASGDEYVTTFTDLDPGTYTVSINMRNDDEVGNDESEVIAISDPVSFTVDSEPDDADPGDVDDGDDADPGDVDDGDDADPGDADDGDDADPGDVDDGDDADPGDVDDGDDADPRDADDGNDADDGDDLLMPGEGDIDDDDVGDDELPDDEQPLHVVPVFAFGLLAFGIATRLARFLR